MLSTFVQEPPAFSSGKRQTIGHRKYDYLSTQQSPTIYGSGSKLARSLAKGVNEAAAQNADYQTFDKTHEQAKTLPKVQSSDGRASPNFKQNMLILDKDIMEQLEAAEVNEKQEIVIQT